METTINCGRCLMTFLMLLHTSAFLQGQIDYVNAQDEFPYLLYADNQNFYRAELDGSNNRTLHHEENGSITGVDFHYSRKAVYWVDSVRKQILKSYFNISNITVLAETNVKAPEGLAVDWINDKLYWTDRTSKTIEVYDLVSGERKTLINTGKDSLPRAIVVDPLRRWLYWSDWNTDKNTSKIGRVSMDGQEQTTLHDFTTVQWPNGLALDYSSRILYWIDAKHDHVASSDLDGSNRRTIAQISDSHPFFMTYFHSVLYWTTWGRGDTTVRSARVLGRGGAGGLDDGAEILVDVTSGFNPTGIQVISREKQQLVANPCGINNGGCSNLCLLSAVDPQGYTCACPEGVELKENRKDCVGAVPRTTPPPLIPTTTNDPLTPTDPCKDSPCLNGGTCVADGKSFTCNCIEQYSGATCSLLNSASGQDVSVIVFMGVVGGLVLIIVIMLFFIMFIVLSVRWRSSHRSDKRDKQCSQSISGLSSTSGRDTPPQVVVVHNTRLADHDYVSIKSRESPAPKAYYIRNHGNGNLGNGTDGRSVQNPYIIGPHPLHQSASSSELLVEGSVNGSKTMKIDSEPIYNNIKSKVQTL